MDTNLSPPGSDQIAVRARVLARTALFGGLDDVALASLAVMSKSQAFAAGETVFRKGDVSGSLYVVEQGRVTIATTSLEGREVVLNLLGPGDLFGEVALVDGGGRTADAVCPERAKLIVLDRRRLIPFLEANPKLMLRMLSAMAERVRWVSASFEDSAFLPLPARMAKRLLLLADGFGVDTARGRRLTVALPQRELAAHMGVTRETINRLLQDWLALGLIEVDRGVVVIRDRDRLARLAAGP
jgi:CRP-like cAMP-binding protein